MWLQGPSSMSKLPQDLKQSFRNIRLTCSETCRQKTLQVNVQTLWSLTNTYKKEYRFFQRILGSASMSQVAGDLEQAIVHNRLSVRAFAQRLANSLRVLRDYRKYIAAILRDVLLSSLMHMFIIFYFALTRCRLLL